MKLSTKSLNFAIFFSGLTFLILFIKFMGFSEEDNFFSDFFPTIISLQLLSLFFGLRIKNVKTTRNAKYISLMLLIFTGILTSYFLFQVTDNKFFNNDFLLIKILSPLLIVTSLLILFPLHVKLVKQT